jgi:hypothetical protein
VTEHMEHAGHWECELKDRHVEIYEAACFARDVLNDIRIKTKAEQLALERLKKVTERQQPSSNATYCSL